MNLTPINPRIRICIIEDHAEFRQRLLAAIESSEHLTCESAFSNAEDAIDYLKSHQAPDILVVDLGLPGISGIEAIPQFCKLCPETKILVLTVFENKTRVFQALGAGASGYLIKSSRMHSIIQSIEEAYHDIAPLSAEIAQMVFATFNAYKPTTPEANISNREMEVLQLLADGQKRNTIAISLGVSRHTIDAHIRSIYRKLQVHNVSGAIKKSIEQGLI
jgi:DNA-binding NarL/FixJ family response regulator